MDEEQKLTAPFGAAYDYFGSRVAIDGDVIAVSAPGDDPAASWLRLDGAVYVYRWDGTRYVFEQKIVPADLADDDSFGQSLDLDGATLVAGSHRDDDLGPYSGSAYVFRYDGARWVEEQKLNASDGGREDTFGYSAALDGDVAVVGAIKSNSAIGKNGAAYVFRRQGGVWSEERVLEASDAVPLDWFGWSVAIDGDLVVAGAPSFELHRYAAYVFRHDGAAWNEEQKLTPSRGWPIDNFGGAVAVDDDVVLVGAPGDVDQGYLTGAAYAYFFDGSTWGRRAQVLRQ